MRLPGGKLIPFLLSNKKNSGHELIVDCKSLLPRSRSTFNGPMGKQILGFDFSLRFFDVQKLLDSASKPWEIESNDQHDLSATPCALTPLGGLFKDTDLAKVVS